MFQDSDIQRFRDDGFLIARDFFTQEQVRSLITGWKLSQAEIQSQTGNLQRLDRFVSGTLPSEIGELYQQESLLNATKIFLQEENIALYMNRLLVKDQQWNGSVANHQDMPYFHGSLDKLAVFIPLQPHNEATGGMRFIRGSHRFGNLGVRGTIDTDQFPAMDVVTPSLEVGDVLFMDFLTWHYSEEATVQSDRPILQIAYQSAKDGSYFQLPHPTLVCGQWQTSYFIPFGHGISQDVAALGATALAESQQRITDLELQLQKAQTDFAQFLQQSVIDKAQLKQLEADLDQSRLQIATIENSKFWKVRLALNHLKKLSKFNALH